MSMISAQIDELRELAGDGSMEWVAGPIRASVLRDAADTIWELRESVHRERAEADKLREERDMYSDLVGMMDHPDLNAQLQAENAKLRELVSELWVSCPVHDSDCDECQHKGGCTGCELYDRMRGLEVDV